MYIFLPIHLIIHSTLIIKKAANQKFNIHSANSKNVNIHIANLSGRACSHSLQQPSSLNSLLLTNFEEAIENAAIRNSQRWPVIRNPQCGHSVYRQNLAALAWCNVSMRNDVDTQHAVSVFEGCS